ncbi:hypothetical protein ACGFZ9_50580 [Streptomyces mirabilis]
MIAVLPRAIRSVDTEQEIEGPVPVTQLRLADRVRDRFGGVPGA